jgi:hypothetical protein
MLIETDGVKTAEAVFVSLDITPSSKTARPVKKIRNMPAPPPV